MDKLAAAIDRVLSFLPFNEYKLYLSLAVKGALPLVAFVPGLNVVAASAALNFAVDAAIAIAATHKAAKEVLKK